MGVLNALRHQRMVQVTPSPLHDRGRCVLNALRHQRMVQSPCLSQISKTPEITYLNSIQPHHAPSFLWHRRHPEMLESCTSARRVHSNDDKRGWQGGPVRERASLDDFVGAAVTHRQHEERILFQ